MDIKKYAGNSNFGPEYKVHAMYFVNDMSAASICGQSANQTPKQLETGDVSKVTCGLCMNLLQAYEWDRIPSDPSVSEYWLVGMNDQDHPDTLTCDDREAADRAVKDLITSGKKTADIRVSHIMKRSYKVKTEFSVTLEKMHTKGETS